MTAFHVTLIVLEVVGAAQLAAMPVGAARENRGLALPLAARRHVDHPVGRGVRHRIAQEDERPRHKQEDEGARNPMLLAPSLPRPIGPTGQADRWINWSRRRWLEWSSR